ncbi:N-acetyltransferase [Bombilactobacillus folatiphilus]|uniref:N-acetyltransferase n=1 Tax=Bombilactobacillus folatiphilus TaxID=2923362 RepID=A0ABY4P9J0_9LACO|nr:GNAT family N-acetyltransferase [Bombilactobacillus folatiphilus]UQS82400.1 N-acetyltransferase [Bombilactobacillus folatiphilus]
MFKQNNDEFYQQNTQGQITATLHYTLIPERQALSIDQVFVPPAFRNQGHARQILQVALDWADSQNLKIIPICPYARQVFQTEPHLTNLLADQSTKENPNDSI